MNKRTKAYWIIAVSVIILFIVLSLKLFFTSPPTCDPHSESKTVILIDHSEHVATQTANLIVGRAWQIVENIVKDGELVSVFNVSNLSKKDLVPAFSQCKPRQDGSRAIEDVKRLKHQFEKNFKNPLQKVLETPVSESTESPIAQAIIDLSLDDKVFRAKSTHLVIFSDFLENTPDFSIYKCTNPEAVTEAFRRSRFGAVERPNFNSVDIRMNIIPRHGHNITKPVLQCRDKFWIWFFGDNQCRKDSCLTPDYLPG